MKGAKIMALRKELIDELMQDYQMTKSLLERALDGELTHHLGHEKHGRVENETRAIPATAKVPRR